MADRYLRQLREIFRSTDDKHLAHARSAAVLAEMTGDPSVIAAALRQHLEHGPGLEARHYPVISLLLESNASFDLVVNCWLPLPDAATDMTTKAIHHHGPMLLTTATAFGPGYEHWTFTKPEPIDEGRELFSMKVIDSGAHERHHVAFVDRWVAHVPLYVPSLTITLALWSTSSPTRWIDHVKRSALVRGRAKELRRVAARLGLAPALDLKIVEYYDFFPAESGFVGMRDRQEFPLGPNADYLQSLLHVVQETGNHSLLSFIEELGGRQTIEDRPAFERLLASVRADEGVAPLLSAGHHGVPHANFRRSDIERALAALGQRG